jgi:chromate reductase
MTDTKLKILAIPGRLRAASLNQGLLASAQELRVEGVSIELYSGTAGLPIFSEELEGANRPQPATDLDSAIRNADAVLIATPEYNGSLPGGLKNLLDWGSRPYAQGAFAHKPVAVIGASMGQYGAARAVQTTAGILSHMGANVLEGHLTVGAAHSKFNQSGELQDEMTKKSLGEIVARLRDSVLVESAV